MFIINYSREMHLNLSKRELTNTNIKGYKWTTNITSLSLYKNKIASLFGIEFPAILWYLTLSHNFITTLEDAFFPTTLVSLILNNNLISNICGINFPPNLRELWLNNNEINDLKSVSFPNNLHILHLDHNKITSLAGIIFPAELRSIWLAHNNLTNLKGVVLPPGLGLLYINDNKFKEITNIKFPLKLELLFLLSNADSFIYMNNVFITNDTNIVATTEQYRYIKKVVRDKAARMIQKRWLVQYHSIRYRAATIIQSWWVRLSFMHRGVVYQNGLTRLEQVM